MQSADAFREYLLKEHVEPLKPKPAGDYVSRLHRVERLLDLDDYDISSDNVDTLIKRMRKRLASFGVNDAVQNDCATALRSYAEFRSSRRT
jgi:hypothetical protein